MIFLKYLIFNINLIGLPTYVSTTIGNNEKLYNLDATQESNMLEFENQN